MKNSTLIILAALAACSATADAQQLRHSRIHTAAPLVLGAGDRVLKHDALGTPALSRRRAAASQSTTAYKPMTQTESLYMDGEWMEVGTYTLSYDAKGRQTRVDVETEDGLTRTDYTWTDQDQLDTQTESTSEDGGATFVPSSKRVQTYDAILPALTLTKDKYDWDTDGNQWVPNYDSFRRTVVRNADNNVTSLTLAVPLNGNFDDTQRITNTFDPTTKQATSFYLEEQQWDGSWAQSQYLHSLVWKKTNGQLVDGFDSWQNYGNYLLSATIGDYDKATGTSQDFGTVKIVYDAQNGYTETIDYTDVLSKAVTTKKYTDDKGSFVYDYKYYEDANNDGVLDDQDLSEGTVITTMYDANGNIVLDEEEDYGIDEDSQSYGKMGGSRYVYTYDPDHDNAQLTMQYEEYDLDAKDFVPMSRIATTAFVDIAAGIGHVDMRQSDESSAVYTLQGMKTNAAGKGVYIVKRGGKYVKVMK